MMYLQKAFHLIFGQIEFYQTVTELKVTLFNMAESTEVANNFKDAISQTYIREQPTHNHSMLILLEFTRHKIRQNQMERYIITIQDLLGSCPTQRTIAPSQRDHM